MISPEMDYQEYIAHLEAENEKLKLQIDVVQKGNDRSKARIAELESIAAYKGTLDLQGINLDVVKKCPQYVELEAEVLKLREYIISSSAKKRQLKAALQMAEAIFDMANPLSKKEYDHVLFVEVTKLRREALN